MKARLDTFFSDILDQCSLFFALRLPLLFIIDRVMALVNIGKPKVIYRTWILKNMS